MADSPGSMKPDHSIRNTLVVGVVGGTLAGFIAAMMLGTFRVGEGDDLTEWISAVAALIAVIISALAVVLVGETLKATRDTLNETRKMSESQVQMAQDQKYIGITQTRPWVCISDYRIRCDEHLEDNTYVFITVKNFGPSPARAVSMGIEIRHYLEGQNAHGDAPLRMSLHSAVGRNLLPPNQDHKFEFILDHSDILRGYKCLIVAEWEYRNHDGSAIANSEDQAEFYIGQDQDWLTISAIR